LKETQKSKEHFENDLKDFKLQYKDEVKTMEQQSKYQTKPKAKNTEFKQHLRSQSVREAGSSSSLEDKPL